MSKNKIISKFRFLENGKEAPKGSRFKGKINEHSLAGWFDYTQREDAVGKTTVKEQVNDKGFFGYTSRDGFKTFTNEGWLKDAEHERKFRKEVSEAFSKKGNLAWDTVVSMKDYSESFDASLYDANDYATIVDKVLPEFFKKNGFDKDNMIWWMNFHDNKHNPHMHITFLEKQQTRTKGKLPPKTIDMYFNLFLREMGLREEFKKRQGVNHGDYMKAMDERRKELMSKIKEQFIINEHMKALYDKLPTSGRLSYNSKAMQKYRREIDTLTRAILNSEDVREAYEKWMEHVNTLNDVQNDVSGRNTANIKKQEVKKLYTQIGNVILENCKKYREHLKENTDTLYSFSAGSIRKEDDQFMYVKIARQNIVIKIPKYMMHYDENMMRYSIVLDDKEVEGYFFNNEPDTWNFIMDNCAEEKKMKLKDVLNFGTVETQVSTRSGKEKKEETAKSKKGDKRDVGKNKIKQIERKSRITTSVRASYYQTLAMELKSASMRILAQIENEKERELEEFIRQVEQEI